MSVYKSVEGGYTVDTTPEALADGTFAARAVVTRQADSRVRNLRPEFKPFKTEVEAASAAYTAALAWIAHPRDDA